MELNNPEEDRILTSSFETLEPIDVPTAEIVLKEIKQILDGLEITFFLHSGACLGAVRDNSIMPWDDDLDLGVIIGLNGFTEDKVGTIVSTFRENGYVTGVRYQDSHISIPLLKSSVRTDLQCHHIIKGNVYNFPGIVFPLKIFADLKEIDFLGDKYLVPNPPEEYLRLKYGKDWVIPKKIGLYEKDVLEMVPRNPLPGRAGKLKQYIIKNFMPWLAARVLVLNPGGNPVSGAEVVVAGYGSSRTDRQGYARLYIPYDFIFALGFKFGAHYEVVYEENLSKGKTYRYQADAEITSGRNFILTLED
ncbi:MAG: LicD family protein [Dehalococcoidales bacterium]|nr:LicD family protein [Dehalococcoidales bacterium]